MIVRHSTVADSGILIVRDKPSLGYPKCTFVRMAFFVRDVRKFNLSTASFIVTDNVFLRTLRVADLKCRSILGVYESISRSTGTA